MNSNEGPYPGKGGLRNHTWGCSLASMCTCVCECIHTHTTPDSNIRWSHPATLSHCLQYTPGAGLASPRSPVFLVGCSLSYVSMAGIFQLMQDPLSPFQNFSFEGFPFPIVSVFHFVFRFCGRLNKLARPLPIFLPECQWPNFLKSMKWYIRWQKGFGDGRSSWIICKGPM